jgi:hypothetical protein
MAAQPGREKPIPKTLENLGKNNAGIVIFLSPGKPFRLRRLAMCSQSVGSEANLASISL